jgi:hypothetical protein
MISIKVKVCNTSHNLLLSIYTLRYTNPAPLVIQAYSQSLRIVFISAIALFAIVNLLVFTINLPHLKKKKEDLEDADGEGGVGNGT